MPMRSFIILILSLPFLQSCADNNPKDIQYSKGDYWVANFKNNLFSAKAFANEKIYCSSLAVTRDSTSNYFYCLNLKTGRVDWAIPVRSWASQPPVISDSFIYYCSYLGDIYKLDKNGNRIWYTRFPSTYGGHFINPINKNLIISTVAYGLREIDCKTGNIIDSIGYGKINVPFPVFAGDTIFQIIDDSLVCKSFHTQSIIWSKKIGANAERLFLNKQQLFYFDDSQRLYCLSSKTGTLVWQSDSVFPKQPVDPHLEFEKGKIFSYFSNLNKILVIDMANGKIQARTNYKDLQKDNYLTFTVAKSTVADSEHKYEILVTNSLFNGFDFRNSFDVLIERH